MRVSGYPLCMNCFCHNFGHAKVYEKPHCALNSYGYQINIVEADNWVQEDSLMKHVPGRKSG